MAKPSTRREENAHQVRQKLRFAPRNHYPKILREARERGVPISEIVDGPRGLRDRNVLTNLEEFSD